MSAKCTWAMPGDGSVHSTPSGYMDRNGFYYCVASLVRHLRDRDGNNNQAQFIFIDGHDSHFSSHAIDYAAENNIHVFFLKSNDSINDQPADMGANSILEKHYQVAMHLWRNKHLTTPFTPYWMNEVLVAAYTAFLKDEKVLIIVIRNKKMSLTRNML